MRTVTPETIAIVKATAPALKEHGLAITTRMYERLFEDKDIAALFDQSAQESGAQPKRLAAAVLAYAQNIDNLDALGSHVTLMAQRHVGAGVKAEHYGPVADALLPAIRDTLGGEIATDEILGAWGEAYWMLADILVAAEAALYAQAEAS